MQCIFQVASVRRNDGKLRLSGLPQNGAGMGSEQRLAERVGYCVWRIGFAHDYRPDGFAVWAISDHGIVLGYLVAACGGGMPADVVAA